MTLLNPTKNQHYISQAEQRLNAIDPTLPKDKQRIFALEVVNRDIHQLRPRNPNGQLIERSLSFTDLFSFDIVSPELRSNLEAHFHRYENDVVMHSRSLLTKLANRTNDIKKEVIELFAAKLMNFIRNPFSVQKVLNTFGSVVSHEFTDPKLRSEFETAMKGSRPQCADVCSRFGISADEYERWLRTLFLLLSEAPTTPLNIFEHVIKQMFESNRTEVVVAEETGTDPNCVFLLSDRGFNAFFVELEGGHQGTAFEFNISARACVCYTFYDPRPLGQRLNLPQAVLDTLRANTNVSHLRDRRDVLVHYNRRTVSHCAELVFGASATPVLS